MRKIAYYMVAALCAVACSSSTQAEEPIQPSTTEQIMGFAAQGQAPTGGEGGERVTVTTAAELTAALKRSGSVVIYVEGTVTVDNIISVKATNKSLIGLEGSRLVNTHRTAEGSGILYFKEGSSNLILRNLTFESAGAYDCEGKDNLCIDGTTHVWVDHCDFQDGVDGNFDCKNASDFITVSWCRFRYLKEPLAGGVGGSDDHRYSNLWGNSDSHTQDRGHLRTTFYGCWWDEGCRDRMPRVRFGQVHIAYCLYSSKATSHGVGVGVESDIRVERSVFKDIKKPFKSYSTSGMKDGVITFEEVLFPGSVAVDGNGTAFTPPYTLKEWPVEEVEAKVKAEAGATLRITDF